MGTLWETIFIEPLYNGLVFLVTKIPGGDVGLAVIIVTILVRLILFPLSYRSLKSQAEQKKLQPKLQKIRKEYEDDKALQSQKILELYKEHKTNPFAGCLLILVQLPIILAVYRVFRHGVIFDEALLYPTLQFPETINTLFLGFIDLTQPSILLAVATAAVQFAQIRYSMALRGGVQEKQQEEEQDPQSRMMNSMQNSMQYMMPVMVGIFAYILPAAVALYWFTSNIVMVIQELILAKEMKKEEAIKQEQVKKEYE